MVNKYIPSSKAEVLDILSKHDCYLLAGGSDLMVVKKNGEKVMFDRDKLARSIFLAVRKRPIAPERVEKIVNSIQRRLESTGESEVQSTRIGELVMEALAALDHVAYIRFASVYRDFREPKDFEEFLKGRVT